MQYNKPNNARRMAIRAKLLRTRFDRHRTTCITILKYKEMLHAMVTVWVHNYIYINSTKQYVY